MRRAVLAASIAVIVSLGGCGGDNGYKGFGHPQGKGLNSPYDSNDAVFADEFSVRPFNVGDSGFTTRPFTLASTTDNRTLSFAPVDRRSVGSLLVDVTDRTHRGDLVRHKEKHAVQLLTRGPGTYQVAVSYPDASRKSKAWKVRLQRVVDVQRQVVPQPASWTKTSSSDGVTSPWDLTSKVLDKTKYSTTPVRVGRLGYTTLPFPVGDADRDGTNEGGLTPFSFIPAERAKSGTLLVAVSTEADLDPDELAPEDADELPEDSFVGFTVKPGTYQVDVSYSDDAGSGWIATLQKVATVRQP